jgi:hypothetical protein
MASAAKNRKESVGKGNPQVATNEEKDRLDAALALASICSVAKAAPLPIPNHGTVVKEREGGHFSRTTLGQAEASRKSSLASSPGSQPNVNHRDLLIPTPVFALVSSHSVPTTPTYSQQKSANVQLLSPKSRKPKEKTIRGRKKARYGLPETITVPKGVLPTQVLGTVSVSVPSPGDSTSTAKTVSTSTSLSTREMILEKKMDAFSGHVKSIYGSSSVDSANGNASPALHKTPSFPVTLSAYEQPPQDEPLDLKVRKFPNENSPQPVDGKATQIRTNVGLLECSSLPANLGAYQARDTVARDTAARDTAARDTAARDTAARNTAARSEALRMPLKKRRVYTEETQQPKRRRSMGSPGRKTPAGPQTLSALSTLTTDTPKTVKGLLASVPRTTVTVGSIAGPTNVVPMSLTVPLVVASQTAAVPLTSVALQQMTVPSPLRSFHADLHSTRSLPIIVQPLSVEDDEDEQGLTEDRPLVIDMAEEGEGHYTLGQDSNNSRADAVSQAAQRMIEARNKGKSRVVAR